MTLEDLIYERLATSPLAKQLARFGNSNAPALFYQNAPEDTAEGWSGRPQYPRADFIVDMQANPERKTSGVLTLNLWCRDGKTPPEALEPMARAALCGVFLCPDDGMPYSLAWSRSDAFEQRSNAKPRTLVIGITVQFDVYAFPCQLSNDPDPVVAVNGWLQDWAPQAVVIGRDSIPHILAPDEARPVFYCRLAGLQTAVETNTVAWMNGVVFLHVFAGARQAQWIKALVDALALAGEVIMADGSPMFLRELRADSAADALTTGQLRLSVRFGLLRREPFTGRHPHPVFQ